jgi:hypothetical protein
MRLRDKAHNLKSQRGLKNDKVLEETSVQYDRPLAQSGSGVPGKDQLDWSLVGQPASKPLGSQATYTGEAPTSESHGWADPRAAVWVSPKQ